METEEIKRRNIALATYMGWRRIEYGAEYRYMHPGGGAVTDNPPFHEDMGLLMPVVWKLVSDDDQCRVTLGRSARWWPLFYCQIAPGIDGVNSSPELALFEAVSSLVMEIQEQQK